jgi:hypothetical protein
MENDPSASRKSFWIEEGYMNRRPAKGRKTEDLDLEACCLVCAALRRYTESG